MARTAKTIAKIVLLAKPFDHVLFGKNSAADLDKWVQELAELALVRLRADAGDTAYDNEDTTVSGLVDQAAVALVASGMWEARKAKVMTSVSYIGEHKQRAGKSEENSRDNEMTAYENLVQLAREKAGTGGDYAFGAVVTSHFPEEDD